MLSSSKGYKNIVAYRHNKYHINKYRYWKEGRARERKKEGGRAEERGKKRKKKEMAGQKKKEKGKRKKGERQRREGTWDKDKEKRASHVSKLTIEIHDLIRHFITISSTESLYQLRHFSYINFIVCLFFLCPLLMFCVSIIVLFKAVILQRKPFLKLI